MSGVDRPDDEVRLERRTVSVDGISLSFVERVTATVAVEPPVLLLHGLIATSETFAALIAELPRNRRVVALDLPGAGYSERSARYDASFAGLARLVRMFMAEIGLHRPVLLGHSHGGAVALRLAVSEPGLLEAMVLLAPAHPFSGQERAIIRFYLSPLGQRFARLVPYVPEPIHWWAFKAMSGPKGRRDRSVLEHYRRSGRVPGTVEHTLRLLRSWQADMEQLGSDLSHRPVELPTLLLWGDHDRVVPVRTAAALEAHLRRWEHFTIPGIGHLPNEEAAEQCGSLIRAWLSGLHTNPKYAAWRASEK